jgi:hypothetical protein
MRIQIAPILKYLAGASVFFLIFFAFYYRLASYELLNINEGLYAEIAREMLVTKNYILPHLNFTLYIEKPPLLYWLIALSFDALGTDVFAARFVTATSGVITCLALIAFGTKLNRTSLGYLAAIIVATSIGFQIIMRMVFFDPLLTACLTIALLSFYIWYEKSQLVYLRCFYIFLGLAVLTKGFIGLLLPAGIIFFFMLMARSPLSQWIKFFDWIGILLFFAVVIPWHVAMAMQHEGFLWRYLFEEQFLRFLNQREPFDYHTGPFYYYLPRLLVYLLPWTCLLPVFFLRRKNIESNKLSLFLWLWFLVPLIFFSLSAAKGDYYMVLAVPPLALLLSACLSSNEREAKGQWFVLGLTFVFLAIYLVGLFYVPQFIPSKHAAVLLPLLPGVTIIMWALFGLGIVAGLLGLFYKRKLFIAVGLLVIIFISMLHLFTLTKEQLQDNDSEIKIGQYINTHLRGQTIYLYEDFEEFSTVLFYVRERMPIINSRSADLAYGSQFSPKGWFISDKEFETIVAQKPVYVVILKDKLSKLPNNFHKLAESSSTVLLTNNQVSR